MNTVSLKLPLYGLRSQFLHFMQTQTAPIYARLIRRGRPQWQVDRAELLQYPPGSIGQQLGYFLTGNDFHLMPGFENHDIFHVLLAYGLTAPEEVELQWCLIGNGKQSVYAYLAALVGAACFPEYWGRWRRAYQRGKSLRTFHHWYYEYLLQENLSDLQHFLRGGEMRAEEITF
jgi:hypothetical protein